MERVIWVEPTTLCLTSVERKEIVSEAKHAFPHINPYNSTAFYAFHYWPAVPEGPGKSPQRPPKSETVSPRTAFEESGFFNLTNDPSIDLHGEQRKKFCKM
jgi:hypothetical protein